MSCNMNDDVFVPYIYMLSLLTSFTVFSFHCTSRFCHCLKFSKMARYDMSGIGINLREVLDENGVVKLKVLGILLDGPAHSAGVRQVALKCNRPMSVLCFSLSVL